MCPFERVRVPRWNVAVRRRRSDLDCDRPTSASCPSLFAELTRRQSEHGVATLGSRRSRVRGRTSTTTQALRSERLPRRQRRRRGDLELDCALASTGHGQSLRQAIRQRRADSAVPAPPSGRGRRGSRTTMSGGGGSSSHAAGTVSSQRRRRNLVKRARRLLRPQRSLPITPILARALFA
jgi:hypothetical protein